MEPDTSPLLTDLYQLAMLQTYLERGMEDVAVFEFFVRKLPPNRQFLVAAGLQQVLDYLESLQFTHEALEWVSRRFPTQVVRYLEALRFTGDVHAMPEGSIFFPNEPMLRITAPLPVAQLIESRLINLLHYETLIASKAARCVLAASGKLLVDFGMRRAHGAEAALLAARASYLAGFAGTATVLANADFGVPVFGTMAHSFIQAHDSEWDAFEDFARSHPDNAMLLIDTYDTEGAAAKVVRLAQKLQTDGIRIKGVRIDSGDLAAHAKAVRQILDAGGLTGTTIFTSGDLDEYWLKALLESGAPIDGFGIGTKMDTSGDAPALDCAYKLQEYAGKPRRKRSEGKVTWPGRKQVYRRQDDQGQFSQDCITLADEPPDGRPLLELVMHQGKRLEPQLPMTALRERTLAGYAQLPHAMLSLTGQGDYPVRISEALQALARKVDGVMDASLAADRLRNG